MQNREMSGAILNWIAGEPEASSSEQWFDKINPATGLLLSRVTRSNAKDVNAAVEAAVAAFPQWSDTPAVQRGMILHKIVVAMQNRQEEIARVVATETGKSFKDSIGETGGAIALGLFFASEGQRLYGRTTTSGIANRHCMIIRQPIGVAGLIIAANTPIANVAWKVFPALICGNTAVLKAAEDTPATASLFAEIAHEAGLPSGVLNVMQGFGEEAGAALVAHPKVGVISFTGSTPVGKQIQQIAGQRLARVSLELGGKNPFVVCNDADMENALKWALLSAFSNAGQRCASGSRIIIFDSVYEKFRDAFVAAAEKLKVGPNDDDDFGPVINEEQLRGMLACMNVAKQEGAKVLTGGKRLTGPSHAGGFYLAPTVLEEVAPEAQISQTELFGPIAILYRAADFDHALELANDSPYGLTACIHTQNVHRALRFCEKVQAGVAIVNAGTFGSEPHLPFGGRKQSGNGTREPGSEALDVYSELKNIYLNVDPSRVQE